MSELPDFSALNNRLKKMTETFQSFGLLMRNATEIFRKFQWELYKDAGCPHGRSEEGLNSWLKEEARINESLYPEGSEWEEYLDELKNRFQKEFN